MGVVPGGVLSGNIRGHLWVSGAGGAAMVALEGAPGGQWWVGEGGEMSPNFSLVGTEGD